MVQSGSAPFDAAPAAPGKDLGAGDAVVRTNDMFIYRVGYSLTPSDTNHLITVSMGAVTMPGSYTGPALTAQQVAYFSVADLPSGTNGCANISTTAVAWPPATTGAGATTSGVSADGQHIVCRQPGLHSAASMDFIARVGGAAPNGATIAPPVVGFSSTNNPGPYTPTPTSGVIGGTTLYTPVTLTVSAAPRWLVNKWSAGSVFIPGSGPSGEDGYVIGFSIGVYAAGSRKGLEALSQSYTITDDFSDLNIPSARLVDWDIIVPNFANMPMGTGTEPTKQNGCGDWYNQLSRLRNVFDNTYYRPNDRGMTQSTNASTVARGGTCAAVANVAAKTAALTLTGTDFSLTHFPRNRGTGGLQPPPVNLNDYDAATNEWWVANKSVLIWVSVNDLVMYDTKTFNNTASLNGAKSVTGQNNPDVQHTVPGSYRRTDLVSQSTNYIPANTPWLASGLAAEDLAARDPLNPGDSIVNQAYPGQLLAVRLINDATSADLADGIICAKIDNARFELADLRTYAPASSSFTQDAATGVILNYAAGSYAQSPLVISLGVDGSGVGTGVDGTWTERSTVTSEYSNPSRSVGEQALRGCEDGDATWYPSIDALQAAGRNLGEVTRVRAKHSFYRAATSVFFYIPLRVRADGLYAYTADEDGTAITKGQSMLGSIAPHQSLWNASTLQPDVTSSDALRIGSTEYVRITKSAPGTMNNGQMMRGAMINYQLQVNMTSGTDDHPATVTVWDVLPQYVEYVAGSSQLGGVSIADPDCEAPGVTPAAPAPFAAASVPPGFKACHWTLSNQPAVQAAPGLAVGDLPPLTFTARVDTAAPVGQTLLNTSFADSIGNLLVKAQYGNTPAPASFKCTSSTATGVCNFSDWSLVVSATTGVAIDKSADPDNLVATGYAQAGAGFSHYLTYTAIGAPLDNLRILDVLPFNGDGRGSAYTGTLGLAGPIAQPVATPGFTADPAMVVRYTSNAPAQINRDPYNAGHNVTGLGTNTATTTNWCTPSQLGSANCPAASLANVTAFMLFPQAGTGGTGTVSAGAKYQVEVKLKPTGNTLGGKYVNDYIADSASLSARRPGSNPVTTEVIGAPGQTISGRVYRETSISAPANRTDNGNTIDPGISGVTVKLDCTSPAHTDSVTTAADGTFTFTGVTANAKCTLTKDTSPPAGYENAYAKGGTSVTVPVIGFSSTTMAITLTVPGGGSTGNLFAEAGLADVKATVTCTPNNPVAPNTAVSCTVTCKNISAEDAINAACDVPNAASLPGNPTPTCDPAGTLAAGAEKTCTVQFNMPASSVRVDGLASADNDSDSSNNRASAQVISTVSGASAIPTLGWPALLVLAALLGTASALRRRRA